jgi:hypothetical protein
VGIISDGQWKRLVAHTGLRSLWTISIECRYCNPLAASASFRNVSVIQGFGEERGSGVLRRRRLTSGCFDVKSMMFPSTIHSVMTHNGNSFGETPNTARTFGWERRLQIMISWNKRCHELLKQRTYT